MKCCANCIGDSHLRDEVFETTGTTGNCDYCGSSGIATLSPSDLEEQFETLLLCYSLDDNGRPLVELLREDWSMFVDSGMNVETVKKLLSDIYASSGAADGRYIPSEAPDVGVIGSWGDFKEEIRKENRFFPDKAPDLGRLRKWFSYMRCEKNNPFISEKREWYRSRIQKNEEEYPLDKMGAPPRHLATHGRANPAGIPYLYLASSIDTAIAEVRPHVGDTANVAVFVLERPNEIKVIDLRHPRKTISPFKVAEDDVDIVELKNDLAFLVSVGEELTHPVLPDAAAVDYTPSQYFCEFVKKCGFDGVMYRSSVGSDVNLALFDTKRAAPEGKVDKRMVSKVSVETTEC